LLHENGHKKGKQMLLRAYPSLLKTVRSHALPRFVAAALALSPVYAAEVAAQPAAYPGGKWEPGPARYGAVTVDEMPVTMDDGTVLRASVAFPTDLATGARAKGNFPVIVEHTPYVKLGGPVNPNTYLTEHGYIYAVVRARGTGTSGGEVAFFSKREGQDGKAIIDWAAHRLEGADGRVGIIGCSWPGGIALTDAAAAGPGSPVKAMVAACQGLNQRNRNTWLVAGIPSTGFWNFSERGSSLVGNSEASVRFFKGIATEIAEGGDAAYDRAFWRERMPLSQAQEIVNNNIPVLLWAGWGDIVEPGAVRAYTAFQNAYSKRPIQAAMAPRQQATPRYQLIMGGWDHAGGLDAGIYLQWMDTWLKGIDTGIQDTSTPMHLYESGSGRWINVGQYPQVAQYTRWRLGTGGSLALAGQGGSDQLAWGDPAGEGALLNFTTPPLEKGATLAGPISATIYATSSNTNLELIARLYDVAPDGKTALITKGAVLGSQRALDKAWTWTDSKGTVTWPWQALAGDDYLKPGKAYRFDIALRPRQWGILPGHRVRLELTTQSPRDVCPPSGMPPQNGTDPCRLTAPQQASVPGATYRILYDARTPSTLNLPQLPYMFYPEVPSAVLPTGWNENQRRLIDPAKGDKTFALPLDWGAPGAHAQRGRTN
jgi:predicted acyl esterase